MKWATERGELSIETTPQIILVRLKGHVDAKFAQHIQHAVDPLIVKGTRPHLFIDAEEATSLDTAFRTTLTPWHKKIKALVQSQNVLVKSKILSMAISVTNLALGDLLKAYNKRAEFQAAMDAATRG